MIAAAAPRRARAGRDPRLLTQSIGTQNPINLVKATTEGSRGLRRPEQVAKLRGLSVDEVLGIQKQAKPADKADGHNGAPKPAAVVAGPPR